MFTDKIALVTGSGNGIGRATALAFAREGATLVVADIDSKSAEKTKTEIESLGSKAMSIQADVTKKEQVTHLFSEIQKQYGRLDILINNVGGNIRKPMIEFSDEEWDFLFDLNLKSMFLCAREAGKMMIRQQSGAVVNISSVHGLGGISKRIGYSSAKSAVNSFTQTLACEWALDGIRVNAIAPGYILTESLNQAFEDKILSQDDMVRRTPQARLGRPEDIADAAVFLCSDRASFITGSLLYVDGGYSAYHGPEIIPSFHNKVMQQV
jgi:3-oxoacyl-[acyl-carrier protein] reductase